MLVANPGAKFVGKEIETVSLKSCILKFCIDTGRELGIGHINEKRSL